MNETVEFNYEALDTPLMYEDKEKFWPEDDSFKDSNFGTKKKDLVRVILGRFGNIYRLSAPKINIVTEGTNPDEAWSNFLAELRKKDNANLLTFDIGPTNRDEIIDGLNIPEDEDWSETIRESEDD